jgi:hypothetical protein
MHPGNNLINPPTIGFVLVSIPPFTATSIPAIERGVSVGKFDEFPDVSPPFLGQNQNLERGDKSLAPFMSRQDRDLSVNAPQHRNTGSKPHRPRATFHKFFPNGHRKQTEHSPFKLPESSGISPMERLTPEFASYIDRAGIRGLVRLASLSSTTEICAAQRFLLSIPAETSAVLASIGRHLFSHLETTAGIEVDVWDEGEMRVKPPRDRSADPVDHDYPLLFAYPVPWKWYRELISCRPPLLKSMPLLARGEELFEVDL